MNPEKKNHSPISVTHDFIKSSFSVLRNATTWVKWKLKFGGWNHCALEHCINSLSWGPHLFTWKLFNKVLRMYLQLQIAAKITKSKAMNILCEMVHWN